MVRPSAAYSARLRLTTKQVNGGYYKGNRTGSMGAHTEYGGYVIDYRKVRNFNCPDLKDTKLTPFVTAQMKPTKVDGIRIDGTIHTPDYTDGRAFIEAWKTENPMEYDAMREEWRVYLGALGETQTTETHDKHTEPYNFESNSRQQAREDAMAYLADDAGKPKSWLGRVFKR